MAERNKDYWNHISADDRHEFFFNRVSLAELREAYPDVEIPDTATRVRVDNLPP